jgi:hypothetical protein
MARVSISGLIQPQGDGRTISRIPPSGPITDQERRNNPSQSPTSLVRPSPAPLMEPPEDALLEISTQGQGIFGGYDIHEMIDIRDVRLEELDKMVRVDGQAAALFNILSLTLRSAAKKLAFIAQKNGKREGTFIEEALTKPFEEGGMYTSIDNILANANVAHLHGFRVFEKVFKLDKGYIVPDKIAARAPYNIFLRATDYGDYNGFAQRQSYQNRYVNVYVPLEKSILYNVNAERNPLYGVPSMLPAFYHFDKKHKMYYIAHIAHQINATPIRVGKVPPNTNSKRRENFLNALSNLGFNTAIVMPDQHEIDQFPKNRSQISPYMDLINHHNQMMTKAVLAHVIDMGSGGQSGSWALSKNDYDIFVIALQSFMHTLEDIFNRWIIPQLIDWNFGTGKYPKIIFENMANDTLSLLRDTFYKIALDDFPNTSPEFLYEIERAMAMQLNLDSLKYDTTDRNVKFDKDMYPNQSPKALAVNQNAAALGIGSNDGQGAGANPQQRGEKDARNKPPTRSAAGTSQPKNQGPS